MFLRRLAALLLLILLAGCASQPTEKWMTQSNHALGIPVKEGQILLRKGYSAGYSSIEKQSLWVSYILYAENLQKTRQLFPYFTIYIMSHRFSDGAIIFP